MKDIKVADELLNEWFQLCELDFVDLIRAREALLRMYPPFMKDLYTSIEDIRNPDRAPNEPNEQVNNCVDKWEVYIDWHHWFQRRKKRPFEVSFR